MRQVSPEKRMRLLAISIVICIAILTVLFAVFNKPEKSHNIHDTTTVNIVERPAGMRIEGMIYYDIDGKWFSKDTVIYLKK